MLVPPPVSWHRSTASLQPQPSRLWAAHVLLNSAVAACPASPSSAASAISCCASSVLGTVRQSRKDAPSGRPALQGVGVEGRVESVDYWAA